MSETIGLKKRDDAAEEVKEHQLPRSPFSVLWRQKGWWIFALALVALLWGVWSWNSTDRRFSPREATVMASVISLQEDGDLIFSEKDKERWRRMRGPSATLPQLFAGTLRPPRLYVALVRAAGGQSKSAIRLNAFAAVGLMLLAGFGLYRRYGSSTPWILLGLGLLSPLVLVVFRVGDEIVLGSLVVIALFILTTRKGWTPGTIPDVFGGELHEGKGTSGIKTAVSAILLGVVSAHRPVLLPLFSSYLALEESQHKKWSWSLLIATTAGLGFWIKGLGEVQAWVTSIPQTFQSSLWYLNPFYATLGPRVGWLWTFPLLLLLWPKRSNRVLIWGLLGTFALAVWTRPWDFAGPEVAHGNLILLIVYPSLWWYLSREVKLRTIAIGALVGAMALGPLWLNPRDPSSPPAWSLSRFSPQRHLPYETSLDQGIREGEIALGEVRVRGRYENLVPLANGSMLWDMASPASLVLSSPHALSRIRIDLDEEAPSQLEVEGADLDQTIFRPNGGIGLLVKPDNYRHHPSENRSLGYYYYTLEVKTTETREKVPMYFSVEYSTVTPEP